MSLINEALKKAQRQRVDAAAPVEPTPLAGGQPVHHIAKRRSPMPARTLVLLFVGGGLVLVTGGILTFVLLTLDSKPSVVAQVPVHPAKIQPSVAVTPPPVLAPVTLPAPPPVKPVEVVIAPAPVVAPVPVVIVPRPAAIAPPKPVTPAKPVANPAINTFIDAIRVTGVRLSGEDSKVILNDRIVRLNDYVDRPLGLRLTKITQTSLGFTDASGFEYTKDL